MRKHGLGQPPIKSGFYVFAQNSPLSLAQSSRFVLNHARYSSEVGLFTGVIDFQWSS
jgi:hypothetical protein